MRACIKCRTTISTIEITKSDFNSLLDAVEEASQFRKVFKRLVDQDILEETATSPTTTPSEATK